MLWGTWLQHAAVLLHSPRTTTYCRIHTHTHTHTPHAGPPKLPSSGHSSREEAISRVLTLLFEAVEVAVWCPAAETSRKGNTAAHGENQCNPPHRTRKGFFSGGIVIGTHHCQLLEAVES